LRQQSLSENAKAWSRFAQCGVVMRRCAQIRQDTLDNIAQRRNSYCTKNGVVSHLGLVALYLIAVELEEEGICNVLNI
jgi:hypothetical protein